MQQHCQTQRWYDAKRVLHIMERSNGERFQSEQFNITLAWIYLSERLVGNAVSRYEQALKTTDDPVVTLEYAESLIATGQPSKALDILRSSQDRALSRNQLRRKQLMSGQCAKETGNLTRALSYFNRLHASRVPSRYRLPALLHAAEIHYALGNKTAARRVVAALARRYPASDEALQVVALQRQAEKEPFTSRSANLEMYAWVYYRNRVFDESDGCYSAIIAANPSTTSAAKATYFKALTQLKRENPANAAQVFERAAKDLRGSKYEGMAKFQLARALFMVGRDHDVIHISDRAMTDATSSKWKFEMAKIKALALRRLGKYDQFQAWHDELQKGDAPTWMMRFYHRNGVVWSLHLNKTFEATKHLARYRAQGPDRQELAELVLWEGLINWQEGAKSKALSAWLDIARKDPNHYTGLVARALINHTKKEATDLYDFELQEIASKKDRQSLLAGYYLAGNEKSQHPFAAQLAKRIPVFDPLSYEEIGMQHPSTQKWIRLARFDLAADSLSDRNHDLDKLGIHYLKSRWYMAGHRFNSSIYHAEILAKSFPRWLPFETLPQEIRQLLYPIGFEKLVNDRSHTAGVDPYLLLAIIREESRFDEQAKSGASARGLMQFIPSTAKRVASGLGREGLELNELYDADISVSLGAAYVDTLMNSLGDVPLYSVAAYNAGEDAVQRWRSMADRFDPVQFVWDITYQETRQYCHKVMGAYHHYRSTYEPETETTIIQIPDVILSAR